MGSKRASYVIASVLVVFCFSFLFAGGGLRAIAAPEYGGHLVVAVPIDPDTFDPHKAVAAATKEIDFNIYQGLVSYDARGEIIPALAKSWDVSEDGKVYTFTLRENVLFHNGRAMTADDVLFSLNRIRDEATGYPLTWHKQIDHLEALGDGRIRLELKAPYAPFLSELADAAIIPKEAVADLTTQPVGTGPFQLVEWVMGQHVKLSRFEGYWEDGLPYLDAVTFRILPDPSTAILNLKAGTVHVIPRLSADVAWQVEQDPALQLLSGPMNTPQLMAYNMERAPFNDIRVRQAINYAIDKDLLIEGAAWGYGSKIGSNMSPVMETYYTDLADFYPHDPQKAKALLAEAGYPQGFRSTLSLPADYDLHVKTGEMVAAMLAEVGIDVRLELVEWGSWLDRVYTKRDYDLTIVGLAGKLDPHTVLNRYTSDYPRNFFNFRSTEYDTLIEEGLRVTDLASRQAIYRRSQEILAEEAAALFIMDPNDLVAMAKGVSGWQYYPKYVDDVAHVYFGK
ncbi:MAG: ABC transporter substrate-binding protein [Firmicutes bacterium]|nr:ABC transporter substrate-binding protein [Bacillota bacterium]